MPEQFLLQRIKFLKNYFLISLLFLLSYQYFLYSEDIPVFNLKTNNSLGKKIFLKVAVRIAKEKFTVQMKLWKEITLMMNVKQ